MKPEKSFMNPAEVGLTFFFSGSFKNSHSCVQLPVGSNQHGLEGLGADKQTAAQWRSTAFKSAAQVSDQSVPKQQQ